MRFTDQFLEDLRARFRFRKSWQAREIEAGGARVERAVAVSAGEVAVVHGQRPEGFLSRLLSGKHGNIFDFVMETEGVSFPEAVERIAAMAGVALPAATPDAARHEHDARRSTTSWKLAAKFFADTLASRNGAKARGYLGDRAITPATQLQFRLAMRLPTASR